MFIEKQNDQLLIKMRISAFILNNRNTLSKV